MNKAPHIAALYDQWHASQGLLKAKTQTQTLKAGPSSSSSQGRGEQRRNTDKFEKPKQQVVRIDPSTPSKKRMVSAGSSKDPFKTPTKPASASRQAYPSPSSVHGSGGSVVDEGLTTSFQTTGSPSLARTPNGRLGRGLDTKAASPWGATAGSWSYYGEIPSASSPSTSALPQKVLTSPSPSRLAAASPKSGGVMTSTTTVTTPSKNRAQREKLDKAIMQLAYTPRTKARKRLRGEPVPKTPAAKRVARTLPRKRGAGGLLVADEEDSGNIEEAVVGGEEQGPETKKHKGQTQIRTLAQFGFGTAKAKGQQAIAEEEEAEDDDGCLGPSPSRNKNPSSLFSSTTHQSNASYQPLFGSASGSSKRQWLDDDEEEEEVEDATDEHEEERGMEAEGVMSSTSSASSPRSSALALDSARLVKRQRGLHSSPPTETTPVPMDDVPMRDANLQQSSQRTRQEGGSEGAAVERTEGGIALKPYRLYERPASTAADRFGDDVDADDLDEREEDERSWKWRLSRRVPSSFALIADEEDEEGYEGAGAAGADEEIHLEGLTLLSPSAQGKSARRARQIKEREVLKTLLSGDFPAALGLEEEAAGEASGEAKGQDGTSGRDGEKMKKTTTWGEAKGKNNTKGQQTKRGAKKATAAEQLRLKEEEERITEAKKENLVFRTTARAGVGDAEEGDLDRFDAGEDEWDSEVDEAEYGLGDGYMDDVDVM